MGYIVPILTGIGVGRRWVVLGDYTLKHIFSDISSFPALESHSHLSLPGHPQPYHQLSCNHSFTVH